MPPLPNFQNPQLLNLALTHRSALNEKLSEASESNERLEFLGDAVLELLTTKYLFDQYPDEPEGVLTAYRSSLVKTTTLAKLATELGLGERLIMSKGEEGGGGRANESLLADTFEAVLGALYLDQGLEAVEQFLNTHLFPKFDEIKAQGLYKDAKSQLQELVQAQGKPTPLYQVLSEVGPDHDKQFQVAVLVEDQILAKGSGKSKQSAHQSAAQTALNKLEGRST